MNPMLFCAVLLPLPAAASDLFCVPETVCVPGSCDVEITADYSFRITNPDSVAPILISHGESIAMSKILQHRGQSEWRGFNISGEYEAVSFDRDRMDFRYWIGEKPIDLLEQVVRYRSIGKCEEQ